MAAHQPGLTGVAGDPASPVHRLDPRAKIAGLLAITLVAVATPVDHWPVYAACLAALAAIAAVARAGPGVVWRRARVVLPVVLFAGALVPLVRTGGGEWTLGPVTVHEAGLLTFAAMAAKATIGTLSAVLLSVSTPFPAVLRGLEALRVPRLFVLVAGMMYRYLFVIAGEVGRTRAALASRGYSPRHALHARPLGRAAGTLFLRTYGRGERVHLAMLARGYDGRMPHLSVLAFTPADGAFVALCLAGPLAALLA
ncbi:MAG: cobalt ECF transporter T component CbiQ [Solirubrobacteraceae bacterium]